jgi:PIN domain nuclease of toxin-antitoxin system
MLLDTHALLWWLLDDPRLSQRARREIQSADEVLVSSASGWEIAIKHRSGKLDLRAWKPVELPSLLERAYLEELPVTLPHAIRAGSLPGKHRDPFDRLLIAQSLIEEIPIVTIDPVFAEHGVEVIW